MRIKDIVKFKGKKNRIALISGSGELPKLIIRELTLNGIEPIVFSPIGIKLNIPGNFSSELIIFTCWPFTSKLLISQNSLNESCKNILDI